MKITKRQLIRIIQEEKRKLIKEASQSFRPLGTYTSDEMMNKLNSPNAYGKVHMDGAVEGIVSGNLNKTANAIMDAGWMDDIWPEQEEELVSMLDSIDVGGDIEQQLPNVASKWVTWLRADDARRDAEEPEY